MTLLPDVTLNVPDLVDGVIEMFIRKYLKLRALHLMKQCRLCRIGESYCWLKYAQLANIRLAQN